MVALVALMVDHESGGHASSMWTVGLVILGSAGASSTAVGLVASAARVSILSGPTQPQVGREAGRVEANRSRERSVT
jgi:hypothetical protein